MRKRQRPAHPDEHEHEEQNFGPKKRTSPASWSVCGATLSHVVNGMSHRRRTASPSGAAVMMLAYSAMKNIENFIALLGVIAGDEPDSASGNRGTRFVSAKAATMNDERDRVLTAFQWIPRPPAAPRCGSATFPARISTGIVMPIGRTIICAPRRRPPSNEYLLLTTIQRARCRTRRATRLIE